MRRRSKRNAGKSVQLPNYAEEGSYTTFGTFLLTTYTHLCTDTREFVEWIRSIIMLMMHVLLCSHVFHILIHVFSPKQTLMLFR